MVGYIILGVVALFLAVVLIRTAMFKPKNQSCGCLRKASLSKRTASDLTKQKFGLLVAERPTEKRSGSNSIMWECSCKCGNTVLVSATDLRSGRVESCGCTKRSYSKKHTKSEEVAP